MPKLQPRFFVIVGVIFILALLAVAVLATPPATQKPKPTPTPTPTIDPNATPVPTRPPATLSFTIKAGAGINTVIVTNQNTAAIATLTITDLPATYNFKNGETLTFKVTPSTGYRFNFWALNDGTFQSQNPYTIKPASSITLDAHFLMETP